MPTKIDQIVAYIEKLEVGSKISIKSLAQTLKVSEGTAYHGIKRAEQMSLVVTLPKAGTTRVQPKKVPKMHSVRMSVLERLTDAETAAAASEGDITIQRFIVADGSEEKVRELIAEEQNNTLCIVGDREDVQRTALRGGAHLLLTGGAAPDEAVLQLAQDSGLAILQTKFSAFHVLNILHADQRMSFPNISLLHVKDLLQPAPYLYQSDIVADARQINKSYGIAKIPVVNEQGHFVGVLDTAEAFDVELSQHISRLYDGKSAKYVIPSSGTISDVINVMVDTGMNAVFVVDGDKLEGMITSRDIIKASKSYYVAEINAPYGFRMDAVNAQSDSNRSAYSVSILGQGEEAPVLEAPSALQYIFAAFHQYCQERSLNMSIISESTVIDKAEKPLQKFLVSVEALSKLDQDFALFECKVGCNDKTYVKSTFAAKLN